MRTTFWKIVLVFLGVLLAGCAQTPTYTRATSSAPAATSTTATPTPLPTADPTQVARACNLSGPGSAAIQVGGLAILRQTRWSMAIPGRQLPDGLPLAPYALPQQSTGSGSVASNTQVNPGLNENGGGYVITVCNPSSAPHTINRVDARLDSVAPYIGKLNAFPACLPAYARPSGVGPGGCGGYQGESMYLNAPFQSSAQARDTVTAMQPAGDVTPGGPSQPGGWVLPATLQPGQMITIDIGVAPNRYSDSYFTTPGTYTFAFGLGVDNAAPVFAAVSTPVLLAPVAHSWSGAACKAAAMQAQIPAATTPPTYYVCPDA